MLRGESACKEPLGEKLWKPELERAKEARAGEALCPIGPHA